VHELKGVLHFLFLPCVRGAKVEGQVPSMHIIVAMWVHRNVPVTITQARSAVRCFLMSHFWSGVVATMSATTKHRNAHEATSQGQQAPKEDSYVCITTLAVPRQKTLCQFRGVFVAEAWGVLIAIRATLRSKRSQVCFKGRGPVKDD
jgi:hypothetical protein